MSALEIKHLFGLRGVSKHDIRMILDNAKQFREILERPVKKVPSLRGMTVVNLFFENSTRTRTSFELAEKRLSADSLNMGGSTSESTFSANWFLGANASPFTSCRRFGGDPGIVYRRESSVSRSGIAERSPQV